MTLSEFLCAVGLLLLIISKIIPDSDGIQVKERSHGDSVATDHWTKEPQPWSVQSVSPPGCPERCRCKNETHHIISVDCSGTGLKTVPNLPETTVLLSLVDNFISNITCDSFKHLQSLQKLSLASNTISHLLPCVFLSQSGSLLNLYISANNIQYLDVNLFHDLSQLQTLDLSFNFIAHLANMTFSGLAQLIDLNLSFNEIYSIDIDAFKGLRSLRTLFLLKNRLNKKTSFHSEVFQDLVALKALNVKRNNGLLDDAISPLRNLSHLYMTLQTPAVLGTGYRQLINLQVLEMSGCILSSFPSNFFDNIRTEKNFELCMAGCILREIENGTFNALPTLVTLDLSWSPIMDFGIGQCSKLAWMTSLINTTITSLDLSHTSRSTDDNYMRALDVCFFQELSKTNLKILSLKGNSIKEIINSDFRSKPFPTSIEKLDVSENRMEVHYLYRFFVESATSEIKLRELHASDQRLDWTTKQISQEIPQAHSLGHFNSGYALYERLSTTEGTLVHSELSDNERLNRSQVRNISSNETGEPRHVGKYENDFGNVLNAQSNCSFQEPDVIVINICLPARLEAIYLRSTFYNFGNHVPHIRVLNNTVLSRVDLSNNYLTSWFGPVENVPSLTFLNLSRNSCNDIGVNFFTNMVRLEVLILRNNYLGFLLAADVSGLIFSVLSNLKVLDVSQNDIQDLNRLVFVNNTKLETLDLSHNRLTGFQPTLSTCRSLSFLDLSHNLLPGLSEQTCQELKLLKSRNKNVAINLLGNRLLFTCDYLPFLDLLISNPHIFFNAEHLKFRYINDTTFLYKDLAHQFPALARECMMQRYFDVILIIFFIVVGTVTICAVIYHKRWKLRYLYYIGRRRMHIGEHVVDYVPAADVFITYDQDDLRWRRFMQQTFLPGLNQRDITYVLGETDFPGGDLMAHVTGAVVGTRKTVVLLSVDIFDDHHREFEMNLSIMREMDTRSLKIIPIFVEGVDLSLYPREIEIFLRNQWERCLCYNDSNEFWDGFANAVREDN